MVWGQKLHLQYCHIFLYHSLIECIAIEDSDLLAKTPGIGKKTALKLIVELQDRLSKVELVSTSPSSLFSMDFKG